MDRAYEVYVMINGVEYWYYFGNMDLQEVGLILESDRFAHIRKRDYIIIANRQTCNEFVETMHRLMKDYPIKAFVFDCHKRGYFTVIELKKGGD